MIHFKDLKGKHNDFHTKNIVTVKTSLKSKTYEINGEKITLPV